MKVLIKNGKDSLSIEVSNLNLSGILKNISEKISFQNDEFFIVYLNYPTGRPSKIGYIVSTNNYILKAQEDIALWAIEKYSLQELNIELLKNKGKPFAKLPIHVIREEISMGDSGSNKTYEISSETKLSDLIEIENYNPYKKTLLKYFNNMGEEKILPIRVNGEPVFMDITFSNFAQKHNVDIAKEIVLYQKK